jgi:hypothetical protein
MSGNTAVVLVATAPAFGRFGYEHHGQAVRITAKGAELKKVPTGLAITF